MRFGDGQALYAGTSDTRTGDAPAGAAYPRGAPESGDLPHLVTARVPSVT